MAGPTSLTPAPMVITSAPTTVGMALGPTPFDVLEGLPLAAAERLRALRQRRDDAHRLVPEFSSVHEASLERVAAENALRRLCDHPHNGGFGLKPGDRRVDEAQRTLDKAADHFERLKVLQEARTAQWQSAGAAASNAENWLRHGRPSGTSLETVTTEMPRLGKNETLLDAVENRRRRVRELRADINRIASSQFPAAHSKAKMRQQIARLAEIGCPDVSMLVERDGDVSFPMTSLRSEVHSQQPALAFATTPDTAAMFCWLFQDTIAKRLDVLIDGETDGKPLSHAERETLAAEAMLDIEQIEREETELTFAAQAMGLPCEHRGDVGVLPLLGLRLLTATNGHGHAEPSSLEHAYDVVMAGKR
jgi:hypothetical protein